MQDWLKNIQKSVLNPRFFTPETPQAIDDEGVARQLDGLYRGNLITAAQQLEWIAACKYPQAHDLLIPRIADAIALESTSAFVVMKGSKLGKVRSNHELPALKKKGVAIQKLVPGRNLVPYGDGSPPPSRSPSPTPWQPISVSVQVWRKTKLEKGMMLI